jgi:hypothetical protein
MAQLDGIVTALGNFGGKFDQRESVDRDSTMKSPSRNCNRGHGSFYLSGSLDSRNDTD